MPTDVPYYGSYGAGSNYGSGSVACDGLAYEDVPATNGRFAWTGIIDSACPTFKSILQIRRYLKIERRVQRLFKPATQTPCQP